MPEENITTNTAAGTEGEAGSYILAQVALFVEAVRRLSGVNLSLFDPTGGFTQPEAVQAIAPEVANNLSADIHDRMAHSPKPMLLRGPDGSAVLMFTLRFGGRLAGYVVAWGFSLAEIKEEEREELESRVVIEAGPALGLPPEARPEMSRSKLVGLVDIMDSLVTQAALLSAGVPQDFRMGYVCAPLPAVVQSALSEVSKSGKSASEIKEALQAYVRLEALYNSTQDAILMLDRDMKIVSANREFGRVFGTDPKAFIGVTGTWLRRWLVKNAKNPSRVTALLDEILTSPKTVIDDEMDLLSPHYMILRFYSAPVMDEDGNILGRLLVFRDITHFREARRELIGTEKSTAIGRVAAGLAHELNNILASMMVSADYALEEGRVETIRAALKRSISAAEKASEIITRFLSVTRPTESQRQEVDIHVDLERLLDTLEPNLRKDNIRIHRLLEAVPRVNVDPLQMQQVFHQIIENAQEAIGQDGTITVRTETDWDRGVVRIVFTDSGPGIPQEYIDRVFDPFFTTKGVVSGGADTAATGLGLSIAKGVVESHGGKIYAGNVLPHGASFVIELPLPGIVRTSRPPTSSAY